MDGGSRNARYRRSDPGLRGFVWMESITVVGLSFARISARDVRRSFGFDLRRRSSRVRVYACRLRLRRRMTRRTAMNATTSAASAGRPTMSSTPRLSHRRTAHGRSGRRRLDGRSVG